MEKPERVKKVRNDIAAGVSRDTVAQELKKEGWSDADTADMLGTATTPTPSAPTQELMPIGELFSKTWGIYKKRFLLLIGLSAIPVVLSFLGSLVFAFATYVVSLISVWTTTAMILVLGNDEHALPFGDALKKALHLWPAMLWISLLVGFASLGGVSLFLIPGIIIGGYISFAQFFGVLEGKRGMNALLTSWAYVRGYWLSAFVRFLLLILALIPLAIVVGFATTATKSVLIQAIGSNVLGLLFGPFLLVYSFLLYKNLRAVGGEREPATSKTVLIVFAIIGVLSIPAFLFLAALSIASIK